MAGGWRGGNWEIKKEGETTTMEEDYMEGGGNQEVEVRMRIGAVSVGGGVAAGGGEKEAVISSFL